MNKKNWARNEWSKLFNGLAQKGGDELLATARCNLNNRRVIQHVTNDIAYKLRLNPRDMFLDLGCGTGVISIDLWKKANKSVGLDFGHDVLMRAKKNVQVDSNYVEFTQGDITTLPFKEGVFSKVLCYSVVMYLQDYDDFKDALVEMLRVCQPGGLVLVGDIPEKNRKEEWLKGDRRKGESLPRYLIRKIRQKIIRFRYRISARQFDKRKTKLNIAPTKAQGMFYDADIIMQICREIGVKGTILDQPPSLAFGNTRVDLLLEKRA